MATFDGGCADPSAELDLQISKALEFAALGSAQEAIECLERALQPSAAEEHGEREPRSDPGLNDSDVVQASMSSREQQPWSPSSSSSSSSSSSRSVRSSTLTAVSKGAGQTAKGENGSCPDPGSRWKAISGKRGDAYLLLAQLHLIRDRTRPAIEATNAALASFRDAGSRLGRLEALLFLAAAATKDAQRAPRTTKKLGEKREKRGRKEGQETDDEAGASEEEEEEEEEQEFGGGHSGTATVATGAKTASRFLAVRAAREAQALAAVLRQRCSGRSSGSCWSSASPAAAAEAAATTDAKARARARVRASASKRADHHLGLLGAAHFAAARGHALNEQLEQAGRSLLWAAQSFRKSGDPVSEAYVSLFSAQLELEFGARADEGLEQAKMSLNAAHSSLRSCSKSEQQALREVLDFVSQRLEGNDAVQIGDWYTEAAFVMIERHAPGAGASAGAGIGGAKRSGGLGHRQLVEQQLRHQEWLQQRQQRQRLEEQQRQQRQRLEEQQQQQQHQQQQRASRFDPSGMMPKWEDEEEEEAADDLPELAGPPQCHGAATPQRAPGQESKEKAQRQASGEAGEAGVGEGSWRRAGRGAEAAAAAAGSNATGTTGATGTAGATGTVASRPERPEPTPRVSRPKLTVEEARLLAKQFRKGAKVRLSGGSTSKRWSSILEPGELGEVLSCRILDGTVEVFLRAPSRKTDTIDAKDLELVA